MGYSEAEITAGIVCCCFPVFPQLYRMRLAGIVTRIQSSFSSSRTRDSSYWSIGSRSHAGGKADRKTKARHDHKSDMEFNKHAPTTIAQVEACRTADLPPLTIPDSATNADRDLELGQIQTTRSFLVESRPSAEPEGSFRLFDDEATNLATVDRPQKAADSMLSGAARCFGPC